MRLHIVLVLTFVSFVNGFKILALFPYTGKSHFDTFRPLLQELHARGHQLTVLTHFPFRNSTTNFTIIPLRSASNLPSTGVVDLELLLNYPVLRDTLPVSVGIYAMYLCEQVQRQTEVREFINSEQSYDLVIAEFFADYCLMGLAEKFKAPLVGISSCVPFSYLDKYIGYQNTPSYVPNMFSSFSDQMDFLERVHNSVHYVFTYVLYNMLAPLYYNRLTRNNIGRNLSSVEEIHSNASIMLVNTHFSLTRPRPLPPGFIEVAGLHIAKWKRPPMHIDKWINESKHGVIYFSLGSMIKGHTFPDDKKQMFINAFGRLPQRVLWKWENETMPGKTDNIMIEKWMPQFDILCHPNVKAFIAHGGMLGVTEAVHCGVPMIIMPQFGDQFTNAKAVEASGGGTILDYRYLDEESIYNALTTALDPKSNKKAKELSARFKDRPLPPLETSIYWIEYVARHGGAPHLRTAAVGMPLYQYLLLDVIAFLVVILFSFLFVVYYISRAILRKLCRRKQSSQKKKKH
ncbi:UDP-glucuronosyltransferase 1-3-like isoform X2 [Photinus pyralis]|uniref:UDP-glucuronosyltransferase 1-3-like isoform X2 n=1 Tax=Photinus pyralis TaxID=7054 RepID=UPI001266ED33|nr:UDP-glucuronosyltransferase 1-3-like isoform X2 [Photinus pyralis]